METIIKEYRLCLCCMEQHEVSKVKVLEHNIFKGEEVDYFAVYDYCEFADEYYTDDDMISANDISMKNAYRKKVGLLCTDEIGAIRKKYGISQSDLAILLGWGAKTITRYESHQVQDVAHDTILRKIDSDPEWFLSLLRKSEDKFSPATFRKYLDAATRIFESYKDAYLRKSVNAQYANINGDINCCGNTRLNFDKVIDVIRYFANSEYVFNLYKVKLMKLMWYADSLSFKRRGHSITGLAYCALPMGAVPLAHKQIIELNGIHYEEIDFGDSTGYKFIATGDIIYPTLSAEDIRIIDDVISEFGKVSREQIVQRMHNEQAYSETAPFDIIQYKYAESLSLA